MNKPLDNFLEKINHSVYEYINKQNWSDQINSANAVLTYNRIDDPILKNHTKAFQIVNHELFIYVESSAYSQHLTMNSQKIIQDINRKLKSKSVHKLRFKLGPVNRTAEDYKSADPIKDVQLTNNEILEIENILSNVDENDLKSSLNNLLTSITKSYKGINHE